MVNGLLQSWPSSLENFYLTSIGATVLGSDLNQSCSRVRRPIGMGRMWPIASADSKIQSPLQGVVRQPHTIALQRLDGIVRAGQGLLGTWCPVLIAGRLPVLRSRSAAHIEERQQAALACLAADCIQKRQEVARIEKLQVAGRNQAAVHIRNRQVGPVSGCLSVFRNTRRRQLLGRDGRRPVAVAGGRRWDRDRVGGHSSRISRTRRNEKLQPFRQTRN